MSNKPSFTFKLIAVASGIVLLSIFILQRSGDSNLSEGSIRGERLDESQNLSDMNELRSLSPIEETINSIRSAPNPESSKAVLAKLKKELREKGHDSVKMIKAFLDKGADVSTGEPFVLATKGSLESAPTLRAFLIAELGEIDSRAASRLARLMLEQEIPPAEWALSLRNYAWGVENSRSDPYLAEKTQELVENVSWARDATPEYLEALDLVPFTRNIESIKTLLSYTGEGQPEALRHAAYVALDKLSVEAPAEVLQEIGRLAVNGPVASAIRATSAARFDPANSTHRDLLRGYLLDPSIDVSEHYDFFKIFPLASHFVGNNLVSEDNVKASSEMAKRDFAARELLIEWRNDSQFSSKRQLFDLAIERLNDLLQSLESK